MGGSWYDFLRLPDLAQRFEMVTVWPPFFRVNTDTQPSVAALLKELGLSVFPQYHEGRSVIQLEAASSVRTYSGDIPSLSISSLLDVHRAISSIERKCRTVPTDDPMKAKSAYKWDAITLAEWGRRTLWTREAKMMFDIAVRTVLGVESEDISFLWFLFYCHAGKGMGSLLEVKGAQKQRLHAGTQAISEKMAEELTQSRVVLSSAVQAIDQTSDDGTIRIFTNASRNPYKARAVIFSAPPSQYARIKWTPALPASKLQFFQKSGAMGYYTKVEGSGHLNLLSFWPELTVPSAHRHHTGRTWSEEPASTRRDQVLTHLRTLTGDDERALHPTEYLEQDWSREEYIAGCPVASMAAGLLTSFGDEIRRPLGRVHFAGTETATEWCGYMDGAVGSGVRAAREVVNVLKGVGPDNPKLGKAESRETRRKGAVSVSFGWTPWFLGIGVFVVAYFAESTMRTRSDV
ncbi:hypothetical protein HKX48_007936 [Thoreauomyces humboldtii]|nr:hypothetical protein HKX48_007936 [Thoreauomyces humboldtii]